MKHRYLVTALVAVLVAFAAISTAGAACTPDKRFTTNDFDDGLYYYIFNVENINNSVGAFWEPGNRSVSNEGVQTVLDWVKFNPSYPSGQYIEGFWGIAGTNGCASGNMVFAISEPVLAGAGARFTIGHAEETPTKQAFFNFSNTTMTDIPRPQVTNRSRVGDIVTLDLRFEDVTGAFGSRFGRAASEFITGYTVHTFSGTDDPGRDAASWGPAVQTVPFTGAAATLTGLDVDCSNQANDVFLAVGMELAGEYETVHLGASTIVECDPTLADPDDKFDLIRDRGQGRKKGKPFRD